MKSGVRQWTSASITKTCGPLSGLLLLLLLLLVVALDQQGLLGRRGMREGMERQESVEWVVKGVKGAKGSRVHPDRLVLLLTCLVLLAPQVLLAFPPPRPTTTTKPWLPSLPPISSRRPRTSNSSCRWRANNPEMGCPKKFLRQSDITK